MADSEQKESSTDPTINQTPPYPVNDTVSPYPPTNNVATPYPPTNDAPYPPSNNAPYPPSNNAPYPPSTDAVSTSQVATTTSPDATNNSAPPPAAGFQPYTAVPANPTEPPPPYGYGAQPMPMHGQMPVQGQMTVVQQPAGYGYPPAGTAYYAPNHPGGAVVVTQPATVTKTTYVIAEDTMPPSRVNHGLHCCISIFFWPWFFVWCCLIAQDGKRRQMEQQAAIAQHNR